MKKILSINRFTGIEYRSSIGTPEHPIVNQKNPPSITDLHNVFMSDGVPLAVSASRKAIEEADIDLSEITHIVATTCTDSANPGFDHYVIKGLGMTHQVEKVLLHGVGCSGGLASLRTAANLALGHKFRGKPARILCVALEVSTTLVRSELDSINETQETRIGVALFSDCASAVVLSNGIGQPATPVYSLLGWEHKIIPDTEGDLGFDVDPVGKFDTGWPLCSTHADTNKRVEGGSLATSPETRLGGRTHNLFRAHVFDSPTRAALPEGGRLRLGHASRRCHDSDRGREGDEYFIIPHAGEL